MGEIIIVVALRRTHDGIIDPRSLDLDPAEGGAVYFFQRLKAREHALIQRVQILRRNVGRFVNVAAVGIKKSIGT